MLIKGIEFKSGNKPVICVPVMGNDIDEIIEKTKNAIGTKCPMIEWRMDCFSDYLELDKVRQVLDKLAGLCNNTVLLATLRTVGQGGNAEIGSDKLGEYYTRLAGMHAADLIDVEFFELDKPGQVIKNIHEMGGKVITSHHDFAETPEMSTMAMIYEEMLKGHADIVKLAVTPKDMTDVLNLLHVTNDFSVDYPETPAVAMSMGKLGVISRICGEAYGSCITFGALGESSAPGQVGVDDLAQVLNIIHQNYV